MKVNSQGLKFEDLVIKDKEIKDYFLRFKGDDEALKNEIVKILKIGISVVTDERLITLINQLENELDVKFANLKELLKEREIKTSGTKKGFVFEDLLEKKLNEFAKLFGDEIVSTGTKIGLLPKSKKGDFVITLNKEETLGVEMRMVVEAKNSPISLTGSQSAFNELDFGKQNRDAREAFIVFGKDMSPKEAGIFRYYPNHGIICQIDEEKDDTLPMEFAYRFLRTKIIAGLKKETKKSINAEKINNFLKAAYEQIKTFTIMKNSISKTSNQILKLNDSLGEMENNLNDIFKEIEKELIKGE
ncbi:hypothetical protein J7L48_05625 [bacterium]|nr:hypothetical protein [bacterium]